MGSLRCTMATLTTLLKTTETSRVIHRTGFSPVRFFIMFSSCETGFFVSEVGFFGVRCEGAVRCSTAPNPPAKKPAYHAKKLARLYDFHFSKDALIQTNNPIRLVSGKLIRRTLVGDEVSRFMRFPCVVEGVQT